LLLSMQSKSLVDVAVDGDGDDDDDASVEK
jgi:hypothetical protein